MKLTLLDLTQNILSSMGSDEVNSFSDTVESRQVAEVIKTSYYNIISRLQLPEHKIMFSLEASGDLDAPVLMYVPANISAIEWVRYDTTETALEPVYTPMLRLNLTDFIDNMNQTSIDDANIASMVLNQYTFRYATNTMPRYYTVIQDRYVVFDGYDITIDDTLQESKTQCLGLQSPTFLLEDDFIPELDENKFPLLLNEAKALAFYEFKQMPHERAEQEVRRQWRSNQHNKHITKPDYLGELPDFGRTRNVRSNRWIRM